MGRTREAALDGAVRAVAKYGSRKATMGDIAMLAGIAKATLYNHFRTRDDVYRAAVASQVDAIAAAAAGRLSQGLAAVVEEAARLVAEHPAVRKVSLDEPAMLARLATVSGGVSWDRARDHVAAALRSCGVGDSPAAVDLVLRYVASQVLSPSGAAERRAATRLLATAVTAQVVTAEAVTVEGVTVEARGRSPDPVGPADPVLRAQPAAVPAQAGSFGTSS
jgi:AcrR family transcriptional regulator